MPNNDGTSTSAEIDEIVLRQLDVLYKPTHASGTTRYDASCVAYRALLRAYPPNSLRLGMVRLMKQHKVQRWPTPGEIIDHIDSAVDEARAALHKSQAPDPESFKSRLELRMDVVRNDRKELRDDWLQQNTNLVQYAERLDVLPTLREFVDRAANIIAQRNAKRRDGKPLTISDFPGVSSNDQIEVEPELIEAWAKSKRAA